MPTCTIDDRTVDFEAHGSGDFPLLFVHGGFGSSADLWRETIARLPPGFRSYAINNFLRSDPPPDGYSVQAFARRVVGFIRAFELRRPVVIGHSMGGVVCQLAMLQAPDVIGGGVLIGSGASTRNNALAARLLTDMRAGITPEQIRDISRNWFHNAPTELFERYVANAVQASPDAMLAVQESLVATDLRDQLGNIACPVLILHGLLDTGRTLEHANGLRQGIRASTMVVFESSGHSPMVDTPREFDEAFHGFLQALRAQRAAPSDPRSATGGNHP